MGFPGCCGWMAGDGAEQTLCASAALHAPSHLRDVAAGWETKRCRDGDDSNEDATPKAGTKRLLASLYVTSFQTELKWLICCCYRRSSVVEMGNRNYTT